MITINNYLSKYEINDFLQFINKYDCFNDSRDIIISDYEKLFKNIEFYGSNKIILLIELKKCFEKYYKKSSLDMYLEWIQSIQKYCFQGGYGHSIYFTGYDLPHHWCVKPEYYDLVKNIPEHIYLACILNNQVIEISDKPDYEYWST